MRLHEITDIIIGSAVGVLAILFTVGLWFILVNVWPNFAGF